MLSISISPISVAVAVAGISASASATMATTGGRPANMAGASVGVMVARVTNITIVTLTVTARNIVTATGILTATMVLSMVILTMIGAGPVASGSFNINNFIHLLQ